MHWHLLRNVVKIDKLLMSDGIVRWCFYACKPTRQALYSLPEHASKQSYERHTIHLTIHLAAKGGVSFYSYLERLDGGQDKRAP